MLFRWPHRRDRRLSEDGTVLLPNLTLRQLLVIAFGVSVRHWYFAIPNVACLAGIAAAALAQPVLGALLAPPRPLGVERHRISR